MTNEQFSKLVRQYEKLVFTICFQMARDYQEAQNLSQETFLSAYRGIDSCPPEQYKPWLCRIASNKSKDYLKSAYARRVAMPGEETLDAIPSHTSPEDLYIEGESENLARKMIQDLQEPYQKVSVLYFLEEKSVDEIVESLKRPKKTVQTQLYRAKAMLREQLGKELSQ